MGEGIVITSGKGGVGKTTTAANVGAGLARMGRKVLMIDTDLGLKNLDLVLGLEKNIVNTIIDVLEDRCKIEEALVQDKNYSSLYLLPAAQPGKDRTSVPQEQMQVLVEGLKKDFDYVIVDSPAGIGAGFKDAIAGADRAVVVTTPELSAIMDAKKTIDILGEEGLSDISLIVNEIRPGLIKSGDMMKPADVTDILSVRLIGQVPDDENVIISTNRGIPLVGDKSLAGQAYMNICRRIAGEEIEFIDLFAERKKGLFGLFGRK